MFDLNLTNIAIIISCLVVSITVHEAMHAFAGHALGDTTAAEEGRLTLNPVKHIDPFMTVLLPLVLLMMHQPPILAARPVPFNPSRVKYDEFGAALIGFAGPLSNLVMAFFGAMVYRLAGANSGGLLGGILETFIVINVAIFVFNMLPIPPLDGSRVLYAFAPEPLQRIMEQIEHMGIFVIIALLFLLLPVISPIIQFVSNGILNFLL